MSYNPAYLHQREVLPEEVDAFKKRYFKLNEDIQEALRKNNHSPIGDGPIDCEGYLKANVKILWLMKEPYDTKKGENIAEVRTGGWYFSREFFDKKKIGPDRTTWYPIINVSHALLTGQKTWDQTIRMSAAHKDLVKAVYHIGYMNVQKLASPTRERTNNDSIYQAFEANKYWLERQFELMNPDVIIGASTLNGNIFEHFGLKGNCIINTTTNEGYVVNQKLFIRTKHPAQRRLKKEVYVNDILKAVEEWRQKFRQ